MRVLYNVLLGIGLLVAAPAIAVWIGVSPRARRGLWQRLTPPHGPRVDVWAHAASVGEAESLVPLLEELGARGLRFLVTTQTWAGRETLRRRLPRVRSRLCPLDLAPLTERSIARVAPRLLLLVETELWPNLIWSARRAGAAVVVVGARISDRSFPRYRRLGRLLRDLLSEIDAIGARSPDDAERWIRLGASEERVVVVGDLKLDRPAPAAPSEELLRAVGPGPLFICGSTHPGEEETLLSAWSDLRGSSAPDLRLVLAPRHVERAPAVARLAGARGARAALRTKGAAEAEVVVLDTVGELAALYGVAELVFCGGSLVPVGGHNLLESVRAGRVVLHGPHLENQRAQVELLAPLGVLREVRSAGEIAATGAELLADPEAHRAAREAGTLLETHRGAVHRSAELVVDLLQTGSTDA